MFRCGGTPQFVHPARLVGRLGIGQPLAHGVTGEAGEMVWALDTIRRVVQLERRYFGGRPEIEMESFNGLDVGEVLMAVERFSTRFQASYFPLLSFEQYDPDDIPLMYLETLPITVSGVCYESDVQIEGQWFFGEESVIDILMCLVTDDVNGQMWYGCQENEGVFPMLAYAYPELQPPDSRVEWTDLTPYIDGMGLEEPLCYVPTALKYVLKETGNGWLDYTDMEVWEGGAWYEWNDVQTVGELRRLWGEAEVILGQIADLIAWCDVGKRPERCKRYQAVVNVLMQAIEMERAQGKIVFSEEAGKQGSEEDKK